MEREIKFRGYSIIENKWIFGKLMEKHLIVEDKMDTVHQNHAFNLKQVCTVYAASVMEESVGQYSGEKDANNVEIYEQDIVEVPSFEEVKEPFPRKCARGVVKFIDGSFVVEYSNNQRVAIHDLTGRIRVVGNLFKND